MGTCSAKPLHPEGGMTALGVEQRRRAKGLGDGNSELLGEIVNANVPVVVDALARVFLCSRYERE